MHICKNSDKLNGHGMNGCEEAGCGHRLRHIMHSLMLNRDDNCGDKNYCCYRECVECDPAGFLVKLSYFKETGKWYADGEYHSKEEHLFKIFDEVRKLRDDGQLPGLIKGHSHFLVLIDVPGHEHNHPRLIV